MRYPCESLGEFRQQLSEAIDLHAQRCRHAPKFISHPAAASTASAMPSSSTLALACEPCQTWISVPAYATNGWHSMPSSQATEDTDHEMAS
jgi:hypothetical protein